jgi:hypothetical protein
MNKTKKPIEQEVNINDLIKHKIENHINDDEKLTNNIDTKQFLLYMKNNGFNVSNFIYDQKFSYEDILLFNNNIFLASLKFKVPIFELLCKIPDTIIGINGAFNMLDKENKSIVREELSKKYNIKIK